MTHSLSELKAIIIEIERLRASRKELAEMNDEKHRQLCGEIHFRRRAEAELKAERAENERLKSLLHDAWQCLSFGKTTEETRALIIEIGSLKR